MRRLEDAIDAGLAARVLGAEASRGRMIAVGAAQAAMCASGLRDATVAEGLGDASAGLVSSGMRSAVDAVADRLDEEAWASDAGDGADYGLLSRRARAAVAVGFALDPEPTSSVIEAVYEAAHVTSWEKLDVLLRAWLDLADPFDTWAARELARLVHPVFRVVDGLLLLEGRHDAASLAAWRRERGPDHEAIERVVNHRHVDGYVDRDADPVAIAGLCESIADTWRSALREQVAGWPARVVVSGHQITAFSTFPDSPRHVR